MLCVEMECFHLDFYTLPTVSADEFLFVFKCTPGRCDHLNYPSAYCERRWDIEPRREVAVEYTTEHSGDKAKGNPAEQVTMFHGMPPSDILQSCDKSIILAF